MGSRAAVDAVDARVIARRRVSHTHYRFFLARTPTANQSAVSHLRQSARLNVHHATAAKCLFYSHSRASSLYTPAQRSIINKAEFSVMRTICKCALLHSNKIIKELFLHMIQALFFYHSAGALVATHFFQRRLKCSSAHVVSISIDGEMLRVHPFFC